jgi:chromosome segregation ATPase
LEHYRAVSEALEKAEAELSAAQIAYDNAEKDVNRRSDNWKKSVIAYAGHLNNYFSEYMSRLSYRGQIDLVDTGTFDEYEMRMSVAFREDETPALLSGQRHSGGERAVSTIMYLMALQEMADSPFRVVDEINQGMDERNERLVFDRIVKCCTESKIGNEDMQPQYFLVSPKLLPALRSMNSPDVTVLLVWNGQGVNTKWQLPDVVGSLKRKLKNISSGSSLVSSP